jgi:hypothetical protein
MMRFSQARLPFFTLRLALVNPPASRFFTASHQLTSL